MDPWKYVLSPEKAPFVVKNVDAGPIQAFRGPGHYTDATGNPHPYDALTGTTLGSGQRLVIFATAIDPSGETWYRVYLPCGARSCSGWVASQEVGREPGATQVSVKGGKVNVRESASLSSAVVDAAWSSQRFAVLQESAATEGCSGGWVQVMLPAAPPRDTGWICRDNLT